MFPALYHAHHSRSLDDLPFWLWLAEKAGDPLLELGCGTGRVLIPLAQAGYRSVGVDHSLPMLAYLQKLLPEHLQPAPVLLAADISHFHLSRQYPLIILPCNTFSTLDSHARSDCLDCIYMHLLPGGTFAVSLPNPARLMRLPARSELELEDELIHPETGNPVQVSSAWRHTKRRFNILWMYDHLLPDGTVERLAVEVSHYLLTLHAWQEEIEKAGLTVTGVYGDHDRSSYESESPFLLVCASRHGD